MRRRKKRTTPVDEQQWQQFQELCELARQAGVETRVEKGNFRGGFCVVEGEKRILFLNKKHSLEQRIAVLVAELERLQSEEQIDLPDDWRQKFGMVT
ncbi:MAG: hypothetical protein D6681_20540 [Calditrichaeota bacterium]|nr:MAG: hypothetical protein D6681_20540 [Calditrichota bacterium]